MNFFTGILLVLMFAACNKKAIPEITDRKAEPPKMMRVEYPPKQTVAPDTIAGKNIFTMRCGRCHGLPDAEKFTAERWDDILPLMIPRAGLNNEESLHVRTYLMAHAAKKGQEP